MSYGYYDLDKHTGFKLNLFKILKGPDFSAEEFVNKSDESILKLRVKAVSESKNRL